MKQWILKKKMSKALWIYIVYENEESWDILQIKSVGKLDKDNRPLFYYLVDGDIQIRPWEKATQYPTAIYYYDFGEALDLTYRLNTKGVRPR